MHKKIVGVIGGRNCTKEVEQIAQELGKKLAKVVDILVCGGLGGIMEVVCKGFKEGNGIITIGIIPSYNKNDANKFVDISIPTGLGLARNVLVVKSADIVVALPGGAGTLSEIAYCLQFGIPVVSLIPPETSEKKPLATKFLTGPDIEGVIKATTVEEAVEKAREYLTKLK